MAASDYPPMLDLITSGALRPRELVARVIGLGEAGRALAQLGGPTATPGLTVVDLSR